MECIKLLAASSYAIKYQLFFLSSFLCECFLFRQDSTLTVRAMKEPDTWQLRGVGKHQRSAELKSFIIKRKTSVVCSDRTL